MAQKSYAPQGGEYAVTGLLAGDQVSPRIALGTNGGYIAWQDNVTDGDGMGISARRLNGTFVGAFGVFRVNEQGAGEQENVRVAMLNDGGAVFVWQGGKPGFQHIYARFLKSSGTFVAGDQAVNTYPDNHQIDPSVTVLAGGNVVMTWSSYGQDGSLYGVYGQMFSPAGDRIGQEFQIHQTTALSQRSSGAAALANGGFVVTWISETYLGVDTNSVQRYTANVYARLFDANGVARAGEFQINTGKDPCANPVIAASPNGGFALSWSQKGSVSSGDSWDVFARCYKADATPANLDARVNTFTRGEQFAPVISSDDSGYLILWTSFGQDGSREGVYGQFLSGAGISVGSELRVNTTTASRQIHPSVGSDRAGRYLVVWSSFIGGAGGQDLFGQRFSAAAQVLQAMSAPFVYAPFVLGPTGTYQPQLNVSWPALEGLPVASYEVYVDGAAAASATVTSNSWSLAGISPGSTHSFQVACVTTEGQRSPLSPPATGTAWSGANYGGIPFEWMTANFGDDVMAWPRPTDDSDGDGASNLQEFLAGTAPTDPNSVLRTQIITTSQGARLGWNSQPGAVYQVQASVTLGPGSWTNVGSPRFAAGASDSILLTGTDGKSYYRVTRLR